LWMAICGRPACKLCKGLCPYEALKPEYALKARLDAAARLLRGRARDDDLEALLSCLACGRCLIGCPEGIDLRAILRRVYGEVGEARRAVDEYVASGTSYGAVGGVGDIALLVNEAYVPPDAWPEVDVLVRLLRRLGHSPSVHRFSDHLHIRAVYNIPMAEFEEFVGAVRSAGADALSIDEYTGYYGRGAGVKSATRYVAELVLHGRVAATTRLPGIWVAAPPLLREVEAWVREDVDVLVSLVPGARPLERRLVVPDLPAPFVGRGGEEEVAYHAISSYGARFHYLATTSPYLLSRLRRASREALCVPVLLQTLYARILEPMP